MAQVTQLWRMHHTRRETSMHAGTIRDLCYARRIGSGYTTPMPISELDTPMRDDALFISTDEHYMMYAHANDIYETTR